jgi:hypothetical protein
MISPCCAQETKQIIPNDRILQAISDSKTLVESLPIGTMEHQKAVALHMYLKNQLGVEETPKKKRPPVGFNKRTIKTVYKHFKVHSIAQVTINHFFSPLFEAAEKKDCKKQPRINAFTTPAEHRDLFKNTSNQKAKGKGDKQPKITNFFPSSKSQRAAKKTTISIIPEQTINISFSETDPIQDQSIHLLPLPIFEEEEDSRELSNMDHFDTPPKQVMPKYASNSSLTPPSNTSEKTPLASITDEVAPDEDDLFYSYSDDEYYQEAQKTIAQYESKKPVIKRYREVFNGKTITPHIKKSDLTKSRTYKKRKK